MRVPKLAKQVLDAFPLVTEPANTENSAGFDNHSNVLCVYSLGADGIPLDPKCALFASLIALAPSSPSPSVVRATSPYVSSAKSLPLVFTANGAVVRTLDELFQVWYPKLNADEEYRLHRSLVETWLHDAWIATVLNDNVALGKVYSPSNEHVPPWPFSAILDRQWDSYVSDMLHTEEREPNLDKAKLSLRTLEDMLDDDTPLFKKGDLGIGALGALDVLVYSYVRAIIFLVPSSALAALVGPRLRRHVELVEQIITPATESLVKNS